MSTQVALHDNPFRSRSQVRPAESEKTDIKGFWQTSFIVVSLMFFSEGIMALASSGAAGGEGGVNESASQQIVFAIIYVIALYAIGFKRLFLASFKARLFLMLFLLVLFSGFWSYFPLVSFRHEVAFFGTTMFGVFLGLRYRFRDQMKLLAMAAMTAAILSLAVAIVVPHIGMATGGTYVGTLRGIYTGKNVCGRMMAVGTLSCFLLLGSCGWKKRWLWIGLVLCFVTLLLTRSLTANGSLFALACLMPLFSMLQWPGARWRSSLRIPVLVLLALPFAGFIWWVAANEAVVLKTVGRNPTLTGRLQLWRDLLQMIQLHPWFGWGYKGFFVPHGPVRAVWLDVGWQPVHSHNGYIEILIDIGVVGLAVFLSVGLVSISRAFQWLRRNRTMEGFWPLSLLTFILGYNVTECSLMRQNALYWVLFVATAFGLYKQLWVDKNQRSKFPATKNTNVVHSTDNFAAGALGGI